MLVFHPNPLIICMPGIFYSHPAEICLRNMMRGVREKLTLVIGKMKQGVVHIGRVQNCPDITILFSRVVGHGVSHEVSHGLGLYMYL